MKKILGALLLIITVSCTTSEGKSSIGGKEPMAGMPNPASKYCEDKGGKIIIKKDKDGNEYGICSLKTGEEIEEWKYFRENN